MVLQERRKDAKLGVAAAASSAVSTVLNYCGEASSGLRPLARASIISLSLESCPAKLARNLVTSKTWTTLGFWFYSPGNKPSSCIAVATLSAAPWRIRASSRRVRWTMADCWVKPAASFLAVTS
jgi:hypothetical protein